VPRYGARSTLACSSHLCCGSTMTVFGSFETGTVRCVVAPLASTVTSRPSTTPGGGLYLQDLQVHRVALRAPPYREHRVPGQQQGLGEEPSQLLSRCF